MNDPIRQALATGDDCELGRILRTDYAALLQSIAAPSTPARPPPDPQISVGGAGYFPLEKSSAEQ